MLPPPGFAASLVSTTTPTSTLSATLSSLTSLALTTPTSLSSTNTKPPQEPENGQCELFGSFAILIQGALGLCALLALVYKRWRERPQRPVKIWFFDVSKQVVGSVLVHIANLLMSMLSSGQFNIRIDASSVATVARRVGDEKGKYEPNPCSFYLLNLAIDTTIGIPILILLLRVLTSLFQLTPLGSPPESIRSGNYGQPPKARWWFKQSLIYFMGLLGMKICVLIIFLVLPWISRVGDWALRWTEGDEALQVIFVMLVFPVIMNATQYYIIDSFIQNQKSEGHERIPEEDYEEETGERSAFVGAEDLDREDVETGDDEDREIKPLGNKTVETVKRKKGGSSRRSPKALKTGSKDYDPLYDGESSPTVVGSASTREGEGSKEEDSEDEGKRVRR
ncbi:related to vacuolar membrane protein [Rhynchosporium secalis]|uniref:Related to vacuolar membrane protein n=1 Tax=Rhynchosporium secalis TaxID=38038 RepID=A0A1E1MDK0_RHYSE|nr:related to vacuolar membrane protein [Rhynchosporium secalis]